MFDNLILLSAFLILPSPSCTNPDHLALLTGTLKTMQRAACDDEIVSLACPRGTTISIQVAQYGKAAPAGHTCNADGLNSYTEPVEIVGEEKCLWPNSMQYSLLQTVVEACQKKPQCKFSTKSKPGTVDPCPLAKKFVEVAYKCRPQEFRSRTGCENNIIKLSCSPYSRIAILDAQYGRTAYESITCPQTYGIPNETCSAPFATEKVTLMCHGKRKCQVIANHNTFGTPCRPDSRAYLKIVYACVPLGVLMEKYESAAHQDEMNLLKDPGGDLFDDSGETDDDWDESNPAPAITHTSAVTTPPEGVSTMNYKAVEDIRESKKNKFTESSYSNKNETSMKVYVYMGIGIIIFILSALILIGISCFFIRRTKDNSKPNDMFTTEAPNIFGDGLSDIDNDIDVSHISGTFYDPTHPDMILYKDISGKGTVRAMRPLSTVYPCAGSSMYGNADFVPLHSKDVTHGFSRSDEVDADTMVSPKSLRGYSNSQFFYG